MSRLPESWLNGSTRPLNKWNEAFSGTLLGSAQGVSFGVSAHLANAMTAIAIACGQDAALVANTHCANITCEATKNGN
jgi:hydroxymethylglutaryl-CoA reductase